MFVVLLGSEDSYRGPVKPETTLMESNLLKKIALKMMRGGWFAGVHPGQLHVTLVTTSSVKWSFFFSSKRKVKGRERGKKKAFFPKI